MVESPFKQRGGLLLIAAPGNLKSTIVEASVKPFSNALCYSDLTLKQLAVLRTPISNGVYQTLGFLELEKLYARNLSVAMNLEGVLKAMVEEGFSHFAFEDKRCWVPVARCYLIASVLDILYRTHFARWQDNGFLRRFLVFKYSLSFAARQKVKGAVHLGELIELPPMFPIPSTPIRFDITADESRKLEELLGSDDMIFTPLNLLRKALVILKWAHKQTRNGKKLPTPMEYLQDLKDGLGPIGGTLEL
jgi:hypothetical protein